MKRLTPADIVSDEEIERIHAYANFGSTPKRQVIDEGVLKYFFGFSTGHTQMRILLDHGLAVPLPGKGDYRYSLLTDKGRRYLRSLGPQVLASYKVTPP